MGKPLRIRAIKVVTGPKEEALKKEIDFLQSFAGPGTVIDLRQARVGTASVETFTDVALAGPDTLRLVREAEAEGCDGAFITCWGNANLDAAREVAGIPVTASGEASMLLAAALGARFSVIATLPDVLRRHEVEAWKLGVHGKFASERPLNMRVLDLHADWEATKSAFIAVGRRCVEEDGADVLIPGCFTFGGLRINTNAQVLDTENVPIAGLYAAGELVGGIFYHNYPGGSGLTTGAVFGRIADGGAAATAAGDPPEDGQAMSAN